MLQIEISGPKLLGFASCGLIRYSQKIACKHPSSGKLYSVSVVICGISILNLNNPIIFKCQFLLPLLFLLQISMLNYCVVTFLPQIINSYYPLISENFNHTDGMMIKIIKNKFKIYHYLYQYYISLFSFILIFHNNFQTHSL